MGMSTFYWVKDVVYFALPLLPLFFSPPPPPPPPHLPGLERWEKMEREKAVGGSGKKDRRFVSCRRIPHGKRESWREGGREVEREVEGMGVFISHYTMVWLHTRF